MPATPTPLRPPEWANRCGCAGSRGSCSHDPTAPTPDNGLGGCGECEPHSDATPTPNAAPNVVMSDACSSSVERSPEAALQGLVGALRARHNPPPGQRAVTTNGWKAVDELELIMRATLDLGNKSEVTVGKRKADTCKKHFSRLRSDLRERMPSQLVEAICNVTAEQLSPERVRTAVMECTDPDESKRSAALKARMKQRGDGVDDSPADTRTTSRLLSTSTSQHATGAGGAAPSRGRSKRTGSCSMPSGSRWSTLPLRSERRSSARAEARMPSSFIRGLR